MQLPGDLSVPHDRRKTGRALNVRHLLRRAAASRSESERPWKTRVLGVRAVPIEVDHTPGRGWFRGGGRVSVRIRAAVEDEATVTCVIPGHHRQGREVHADLIKVEDGELSFEVTGRCGYEANLRILIR
jgi:hypothetical protein